MLKIRLTKTGKKNSPSYRIVVANRRSKRDGDSLAILGYYNPRTTPRTIEYNKDEAKKWMDKGAIPTDTVRALFERTGLLPKLKGAKKKFHDAKGKKATAREATAAESKAVKSKSKEVEVKEPVVKEAKTKKEEPTKEKPDTAEK